MLLAFLLGFLLFYKPRKTLDHCTACCPGLPVPKAPPQDAPPSRLMQLLFTDNKS